MEYDFLKKKKKKKFSKDGLRQFLDEIFSSTNKTLFSFSNKIHVQTQFQLPNLFSMQF